MYESLIGVAFAATYAGVVSASRRVPNEVYARLTADPAMGVEAVYFDHADNEGALWLALGGEHPEPVIRWLQRAQEQLDCTTMLTALIKNEAPVPSISGYHFRVGRSGLSKADVEQLISMHAFTVYLPHSDEFLVLVQEFEQWAAISRALDERPERATRIARRTDIPSATREEARRSRAKYDPIDAQVHEVMGAVTSEARQAARDLAKGWIKSGLPVPRDVETLDIEIEREERRIAALRQGSGSRAVVLAQIDEYAHKVRMTRRVAVELASKLTDYELIPQARMTYERIATPMMLRAMERYATSIAVTLKLGHTFLPLIGEDFGMRTALFSGLRLMDGAIKNKAVIVDVPAEARLRLGALPMIARQVVRMMTHDIDRIARLFENLYNKRDQRVVAIIPPTPESRGSASDWTRIEQGALAFARGIAADLLATAAAGPQFIFALSRFAVGTLSELDRLPGSVVDAVPAFRTRIALCVDLLRQLGVDPRFESVYLLGHHTPLPLEVVSMVNSIVPDAGREDEAEIEGVRRALTAGRVVRARPEAILAVLWRAVATRGEYVNEVAALVSVAAAS